MDIGVPMYKSIALIPEGHDQLQFLAVRGIEPGAGDHRNRQVPAVQGLIGDFPGEGISVLVHHVECLFLIGRAHIPVRIHVKGR